MKQTNFFSLTLLNPKEKLLLFIMACLFIALSFNTTIEHHGESFLVKVSEKMLPSMELIAEMKSLAAATSSSRIPLVSGAALNISQTFDKIFNYVMLANIFLLIQITLIGLSQLLIIKLCAIAALCLSFIKSFQKMALRVFVLLIFINPGMPLYLSGISYISQHTNIQLMNTFQEELKKTHQEFAKKHTLRIDHEAKLKKENLLEEIGHALVHTVTTIEADIVTDLKFFTEFTKNIGNAFIKKSIKLLVAHIILFLLLPILYIYMFLLVLNKLFNFPIDKDHINEMIEKIKEIPNEKVLR